MISGSSFTPALESEALLVATTALNCPMALLTGTSIEEVLELTGTFSSWIKLPLRSNRRTVTNICSPATGGLESLIRTTEELPEPPALMLTPATSAEGGAGGAEELEPLDGGGLGGATAGVPETPLDAVPAPTEFRARIFTG